MKRMMLVAVAALAMACGQARADESIDKKDAAETKAAVEAAKKKLA